ncbi:alpha-D-ribose 1-methylphosphonate 5-triphosphate diphosphatase [Streptomyces capparidis]
MWTADAAVVPGRVLSPGTVVVDGEGVIEAVLPRRLSGAHDLGSRSLLVPGAVDLLGDAVEHLAEPRPEVRMPLPLAVRALDQRLAAAGVTTAFAALSLTGERCGLRDRASVEALGQELRSLPDSCVQHRVHLRVGAGDEEVVAAAEHLLRRGMVAVLSVAAQCPVTAERRKRPSRVVWPGVDGGPCLAAEDEESVLVVQRLERLAAAARRAHVPLACHDPDSPEAVVRAGTLGAAIAAFPATVHAARAAGPAGMVVAMGAPGLLLRGSADGGLSATQALAASALDLLVSDYYPEALWPAVLGTDLPLPEAVDLVTGAPARAARLTDRGALAQGRRGDLVALGPDGTVRRTIVGGRIAV